jgi:p-cumate 2,3-dioxygenase subunit beta
VSTLVAQDQTFLLSASVTHFLTTEADLLDRWALQDWLSLFSISGRYVIAPLDEGVFDQDNALFLAVDDRKRLEARVRQLTESLAWAERPKSRTRHIMSNVLAVQNEEGSIMAQANGMVHQFRNQESCFFVGRFEYNLRSNGSSYLIEEKRVYLDHETIRDQRRISILL